MESTAPNLPVPTGPEIPNTLHRSSGDQRLKTPHSPPLAILLKNPPTFGYLHPQSSGRFKNLILFILIH
jgi:hypothetical protein